MRVNILQVRLVSLGIGVSLAKGFDCSPMSCNICPYSASFKHHYIIVEQKKDSKALASHYYICKGCGHEKPLEDACVIEMDHQHDYRNYRGCTNGFYIFRCTHFGCDSFLRIFNPESQACTNIGKRHLEDD